jgi:hypothetical protein
MNVTAYHEAGHCAAMLVFDDPIALATIDGETGSVARPHDRRYSVNDGAGRERALEYIIICLAGIAAERRVAELSLAATDTDRKMAFTLACKLYHGDWDLADALVERLEALARRLDTCDRLEAKADALLERENQKERARKALADAEEKFTAEPSADDVDGMTMN